jgi:TPR repeat protein
MIEPVEISLFSLFDKLLLSTGTVEDAAELKNAADDGNHIAEGFYSVLLYVNRPCIKKDKALAASYMQRALPWLQSQADDGDAYSQLIWAYACHDGNGVAKSYDEAARLLNLAAAQGVAAAQCMLGVYYYYGYGVTADPPTAVRLFSLACDQGLADGEYWLGLCHGNGHGTEVNSDESIRLFRQAADKGQMMAQMKLKQMKL